MAFPPAAPFGAGMGPLPGASVLDGPPPSPTPMGGDPQGGFSMRGLANTIPSSGMPMEVLTGITQSAQQVQSVIDSWAQITPDQTGQLALIKDLLAQYLASLMPSGAGAVAPTFPGGAPPMGGMDRGIAGPGAV